MPFARSLAVAAAFAGLFSSVTALDCVRGGVSNTTAVRKTYPVPPIVIYPLTGDFFNTAWSTIYSFNYSGITHPPTPPNSSTLAPPNATRTVSFQGYEFNEQLIYINDSYPIGMFNLRWNLTNPPVTKKYSSLAIDGYVQDFKITAACDSKASLLEWTVEYCSSNQAAAWDLFQNKTLLEADNLAQALNITGADDGTWDIGCALPTSTAEPTSTGMPISTGLPATTTSGRMSTSRTATPNIAMATTMPKYGGALAIAVAAAAIVI